MAWLVTIFGSRKLVVTALGVAGILANDLLGRPVSAEAMWAALGLMGAWLLGQGVADGGKQGLVRAVRADRRYMARGAAAVARAAEGHDVPSWADTVAADPVDAASKVLNG